MSEWECGRKLWTLVLSLSLSLSLSLVTAVLVGQTFLEDPSSSSYAPCSIYAAVVTYICIFVSRSRVQWINKLGSMVSQITTETVLPKFCNSNKGNRNKTHPTPQVQSYVYIPYIPLPSHKIKLVLGSDLSSPFGPNTDAKFQTLGSQIWSSVMSPSHVKLKLKSLFSNAI